MGWLKSLSCPRFEKGIGSEDFAVKSSNPIVFF